jgi:hypothetical protein
LKARKPGVASPGMFQPPRLQGPCVPKSGPQAAIRRCKKEAPACGALCSMLSERGTCPMLPDCLRMKLQRPHFVPPTPQGHAQN